MIFLATDLCASRSRLLIGDATGRARRALRRETLAGAAEVAKRLTRKHG